MDSLSTKVLFRTNHKSILFNVGFLNFYTIDTVIWAVLIFCMLMQIKLRKSYILRKYYIHQLHALCRSVTFLNCPMQCKYEQFFSLKLLHTNRNFSTGYNPVSLHIEKYFSRSIFFLETHVLTRVKSVVSMTNDVGIFYSIRIYQI